MSIKSINMCPCYMLIDQGIGEGMNSFGHGIRIRQIMCFEGFVYELYGVGLKL